MRTLILTSQYGEEIQSKIIKLLPAPAEMLKIAFIYTARKQKLKSISDYDHHERDIMLKAGFSLEFYDIEGKIYDQVREDLADFDIIYVAGGNTYLLMDAMHGCDFKNVVRELLEKGIIYIGESAGSIVAAPDIRSSAWCRDENNVGLKDLTGLFLVDFAILPHYKGHFSEEVGKEIVKAPCKVKFLRDDQLLFIHGDKVSEL